MNIIKDVILTLKGIQYYRNELIESQYSDVDTIKSLQFEKIRTLLIKSFNEIKFYRDLFESIGFDPNSDFNSLDDIEKIPILTKETARENQSNLINPNYSDTSLEFRTSGTTGDKFVSYVSENQWIVEQGIVWRHWKWAGYKFRDKMAIIRSYVPEGEDEGLWKYERMRNFLFFSAYHLNAKNAKIYLDKIKDWNPKFLRGYPSSLYILAKMAEKYEIRLDGLKGILTASETLLPHYREKIESVFGAKVFDWYGQAEATIVFTECEAHEGMHINSEYGFCELIKDPSLDKGEYKIVATNLNNFAMPLIRYDTGDVAVAEDQNKCSCGRTLPLIKSIKGRSDDFLFGDDGREIPSVNLYTMMYKFDEIVSFQFVQEKEQEVILKIEGTNITDEILDTLRNKMLKRFGADMKINIDTSGDFILSGEGKKNPIINRLN